MVLCWVNPVCVFVYFWSHSVQGSSSFVGTRVVVVMDPTTAEINAMVGAANPLKALVGFEGETDGLWDVMSQDLGGIVLVRDVIYIAQADWDEAVASGRVTLDDEKKDVDGNVIAVATKRKLNPKEKAMFGIVRRWARMMVGLDERGDGRRPS